ncbi:outer membrane beta-barrel protein [Pedobacter psychroterrae]|uniref:Outer membrane protein beta-barrel domain-containing protein n=1 Tax=Pedobacter psychroterrae TaxID=2530453 RepID=A0A4R0NFG1_9SPHI|nr:outer membrane beta-barrel protein [Pedobacter psychroterrae]TCC98033.1 hypothetical protein EZ437_19495 [Pedobacter psychroterrae]
MNKTLLLKASIIGCLLFSTLIGTAQENLKRHTIGISYGFGQGDFVQLTKVLVSPSYEGESVSKYGIQYAYDLNGVQLETGLHYLIQDVDLEFTSSPNGTQIPKVITPHQFKLLSIPVGFRVNFLKYLFFNGAALIDIEVENTGVRNQSALGGSVGVGANYFFKNNIGIFVNPQIAHRALRYFKENSHQKYVERNISFGLAYKL